MSDEAQPTPKPPRITLAQAALSAAAFLAFYVLSAGPAFKLAAEHVIPDRVMRIYIPLEALTEIPLVNHAWSWYLYDLWQNPCVRFPRGLGPDV